MLHLVQYEIAPSPKDIPVMVLFSACDHRFENPEWFVSRMLSIHKEDTNAFARALLNAQYMSDSGSHRMGDYMFHLSLEEAVFHKRFRVNCSFPGSGLIKLT